jgi:hypothetical protein
MRMITGGYVNTLRLKCQVIGCKSCGIITAIRTFKFKEDEMDWKRLMQKIFKPFRPIEMVCTECGQKIVIEKVADILPDLYEVKQIMRRGWYTVCSHCKKYVYLPKDLEAEIDELKK